MVVVALVRNPERLEAIEDRRAIEAARLIDVALLREVELIEMGNGVVVGGEVPGVARQAPGHVLDRPPREAVLDERARQRLERSRPPERRARGGQVEEVPVAVLARPASREQRGDRA